MNLAYGSLVLRRDINLGFTLMPHMRQISNTADPLVDKLPFLLEQQLPTQQNSKSLSPQAPLRLNLSKLSLQQRWP
eukprot:12163652-Ditylum_brightwellii.AAC.1